MIRALLRSRFIGRHRKGAVTMMAIAGMIPAAAILAANMNSGQMTSDRRAAQDASDMLAMVHGQWTARAMNVISMNQVAAAQALTVAIGSEALDGTLFELEATAWANLAYISGHGLANCPPQSPNWLQAIGEALIWTPYCTIDHVIKAIPAASAISKARRIDRAYDPGHGIRVSHAALRALESMNLALIRRHPRAMHEIAVDHTDFLDIDDFHFADPCINVPGAICEGQNSRDGMALPLENGGGAARAQLCLAMRNGTTVQFTTFANRGFPFGRGPMLHGGSNSVPEVKPFINDETGIGRALADYKDYYSRNTLAAYLARQDNFPEPLRLLLEQRDDGPNSFTRRFDAKFLSLCVGAEGGDFLDMTLRAPVPTIWQLRGIPATTIPPPVRPEDMPPPFQILAYAQTETDERVGTRVLGNATRFQHGYAQVGVYNPDGADLFAQNWRSVMMPALRMDDPQRAGRDLALQGPSAFDDLAATLQRVSDYRTWGRVNAH